MTSDILIRINMKN